MAPETIVAISTPPGRGAIGIVRLSGALATAIATRLTARRPLPRRAMHCAFLDADGAAFDDGMVVYAPGPGSYTGEDVIEFQGHGNPVLLERLLSLACVHGARPARPGEFTERAYRNGRLDLAQAEAVADLIGSQTLRAARSAQRTLAGEFGRRVHALIEQLHGAHAELEASIDFADDVAGEVLAERQAAQRLALTGALRTLLARAGTGARLVAGARIALLGAPNVGKSSLLNRLAGVERAIVTAIPGTTRDVVDSDVLIGAVPVRLFDTAGLRETHEPIEAEGVRRARAAGAEADLVLHVIDHDGALPPLDMALEVPLVVVRNKVDLEAGGAVAGVVRDAHPPRVAVSALTGAGIEALIGVIEERLGVSADDEGEFAARARHLDALRRALDALETIDPLHLVAHPELVAEHYRTASAALETIGGRYGSEELLGDIFSRFCIGK